MSSSCSFGTAFWTDDPRPEMESDPKSTHSGPKVWISGEIGGDPPSHRAAADRWLDSTWTGLAIWTLCCHAVVFLGGNLLALIPIGLVLTPLGVLALSRYAETNPLAAVENPVGVAARPHVATQIVLFCLVFLLAFSPPFQITWWLTCGFLFWGMVMEWRRGGALTITNPAPPKNVFLIFLVLLAVLATLSIRRPNEDDAFYVGLAVHAADFPDEALLSSDPLHGRSDLPLWLGTNRLRSHELLAGCLSWVTGVPAIAWLHLALPALAACLMVLAYGRLYRLLAPDRWQACLIVTIAYFLMVGDGPQGFSNFGLARLHQGKAIFVSAALPLLFAYCLEFLGRPDWRHGLRLAILATASIGLSPSAIWVVPATAGATLLACLPRSTQGWLSVVKGCAWVLAVPLAWAPYVRTAISKAGILSIPLPLAEDPLTAFPLDQLTAIEAGTELGMTALNQVLGTGAWSWVAMAFVVGSWTFCRNDLARRFALVVPAVFFGLYWNPFTAKVIAGSLTGTLSYWRVFWLVPFPCLLSLSLTAALPSIPITKPGWQRWTAGLLPAALILSFLPAIPLVDPTNGSEWAPFQLKVPVERSIAKTLVDLTSAGDRVVVPFRIGPWMSTFHGHAYPEVSRLQYLRPDLGPEEALMRLQSTYLVSGSHVPEILDGAFLQTALDDFGATLDERNIRAVCMDEASPFLDLLRSQLGSRGFRIQHRDFDFEIWERLDDAKHAGAQPPRRPS